MPKSWTYCENNECNLDCERKLADWDLTKDELKHISRVNLKEYYANNSCKLFIKKYPENKIEETQEQDQNQEQEEKEEIKDVSDSTSTESEVNENNES